MTKSNLTIPKISVNEFDLADACARELWRGYNYSDDYLTISDETFMHWFGEPFINLQQIHAASLYINPHQIDQFISVINMRDNRINRTLDITSGIGTLEQICKIDYANWKRQRNARTGGFTLAHDSVKRLGESFFKQNPRLKNGKFYPLASRVMFFAAPDLPVFNISDKVCKSLGIAGIKKEPHLLIFNTAMEETLRHYWKILLNYQMPLPNGTLEDKHWMIAKDGGWWQRRILDLAIMINARRITVKNFLKKIPFRSERLPY
jgi:hypothetical protein